MAAQKLHPGIKWVFFLQNSILAIVYLIVILYSLSYLSFFILALTQADNEAFLNRQPYDLFNVYSVVGIILISLIYATFWSILTYNNWEYEFAHDGLTIRRGIIWKNYSSIPYERIQNIDISRGIIARIFGFSTLSMHTAGVGGVAVAEGNIPAVSQEYAEQIREWLIKTIKKR